MLQKLKASKTIINQSCSPNLIRNCFVKVIFVMAEIFPLIKNELIRIKSLGFKSQQKCIMGSNFWPKWTLGWLIITKENKCEEQCAQSKGRLLQLQIQALKVTESGYQNSSRKFIMAKHLK